jgi:hypothetical protein
VLLAVTAQASAAPVHDCGAGQGGGYRNVTARNIACWRANDVAHELDLRLRPCLRTQATKAPCTFRWGAWTVRGRWITDRYRLSQLDIRATAGVAVVRFQSDWDGE